MPQRPQLQTQLTEMFYMNDSEEKKAPKLRKTMNLNSFEMFVKHSFMKEPNTEEIVIGVLIYLTITVNG